ncbi:MAG: TonB-dependent receptor, partial [Pseudomonadota bacterium]
HPSTSSSAAAPAFRLFPCLALGCFATMVTAQTTDTQEPLVEQVIVSASRVPESGFALALPWSQIDTDAIELTAAVHINQLLQRAAGTWISRGNGQESLTAVRSPVLTGSGGCGAFYVAWDGISVRGPGFCNVNQLFDLNSEQAGSLEVIRGPGTAVFGANAVHGVINSLSADPAIGPRARFALEAGPHDYYRLRGELRQKGQDAQLGVYFNGTSDGGFKDDAGFDQQKLTVRYDTQGTVWTTQNAVELTNLNQETAGFVTGFEAYEDPNSRRLNPNPEAYRDSFSLRAYSRWERAVALGHLSITPYVRRTSMEFLQHFLPWQPTEKNSQSSLGLRLALSEQTGEFWTWQAGMDLDFTQGRLSEIQAEPFSLNQPAGVHYDYDVDASSIAAYLQNDWKLSEKLSLAAGIRGEFNEYDYDNQASDGSACVPEATACRFFRPGDRSDDFFNGSLNIGLTYELNDHANAYLRLARGFRPPQATELYRLQAGQSIADLDSETIDSIDVGFRSQWRGITADVFLFAMDKSDVIFQDADRQNVSGAETSHRGIEFSLRWQGESGWYAGLDGSFARHQYESSANLLGSRIDIEGNDIDTAPREFGSGRIGKVLSLPNQSTLNTELEWIHLGDYYLNPDNTAEYEGHDLLNLRFALVRSSGLSAAARITNLLDTEYAERADFGFGSFRYFVGQPRGVFFELSYSID